VLVLLCESGTDSCGRPGVQSAIHDTSGESGWSDRDDAYVEHSGDLYSFEYYLGLKGSVIAKVTGYHIFRLNHDWSFPSTSMPEVDFDLEGSVVRTNAGTYDRGLSAIKDFRYSYELYYAMDKKNSWMELIIVLPDNSSRRINDEYGETCYVSGCRNTELSRGRYNCQPSPTRSKSASRSRSKSPTPSPTLSSTPEFTSSGRFPFHDLVGHGRHSVWFLRYGIFTFL
jgi:hypothetical protein